MKLLKLQLALLLLLIATPLVKAQVINTFIGNGTAVNTGDGGPVISATLNKPSGVNRDAQGNIYIICNNVLRKTDGATGIITTIAGDGVSVAPSASMGDGGPAISAIFTWMRHVLTDAAGNILIVDYGANNIRKVNAATGIITTVAGNKLNSHNGDGGLAINAGIAGPTSIAMDASGNLYIAETHSNRIRKVDAATGIISTIAGTGVSGFSGDGGLAANAGITAPQYVYTDPLGNLFVIEYTTGITCRIRKMNLATGIIQTVAGNGQDGFSGDGGPATGAALSNPAAVVTDKCGNIFITTINDSRIRRVDAVTGIITTIAGDGTNSYDGDGGLAINGKLNNPNGMCIDPQGTLFIADVNNNRLRRIDFPGAVVFINTPANVVCPAQPITFTTTVFTTSDPQVYQWKKNGIDVGANSAIYTTTINDKDTIECWLDRSTNCYETSPSKSNPIGMSLLPQPTVRITAAPGNNCGVEGIDLTAVTSNAINPVYEWTVNGKNVYGNFPTYRAAVTITDSVVCKITCQNLCGATVIVSSQAATLKGRLDLLPLVTTVSTNTIICAGTPITFTATNESGNLNATFRWLINGTETGVNGTVFTSASLTDSVKVECIMTVPMCPAPPTSTKDYSDPIYVTILPNITPAITIAASATNICKGTPVFFKATATASGNNPLYQWKINGNNAGTNNTAFSSASLQNGDVVTCFFDAGAVTCSGISTALSNPVTMKVSDVLQPVISISSSDTNICTGTSVTLTAAIGGNAAKKIYQWYLNGNKIGANSAVYTSASLANGDKLSCQLEGDSTVCQLTAVSNNVIITVRQLPTVIFNPTALSIQVGGQANLNAITTGNIASFLFTPVNKLVNPATLSPLTIALADNTNFTIQVTDINGCKASKNIIVSVWRELLMPKSFTPNSDGINDVFRIPPGVRLKLKEFSIYDRWSKKIFSTSDISKGWDGNFNGTAYGTGTFIYIITGIGDKGDMVVKGNLVLLR